MENKPEKIVSIIDACLGDIDPHADPDVIAEEAWQHLQESVDEGWLTQDQADEMFHTWFYRDRPE